MLEHRRIQLRGQTTHLAHHPFEQHCNLIQGARAADASQRIQLDRGGIQFLPQAIVQIPRNALTFAHFREPELPSQALQLFGALAYPGLEQFVGLCLRLDFCERGVFSLADVGKGDYHPTDLSIILPVGHDAAKIDAFVLEFVRAGFLRAQHRYRIVDQRRVNGGQRQVCDRTRNIRGQEIEKPMRRGRKPLDPEGAIQAERGDLIGRQEIAQVRVCDFELRDLSLQLRVDGIELLVDRLQLFLGTLELLIHRLQFFVNRHRFFVRSAQILVRNF